MILRIRQPFRATALIFNSGKMVVTGTKSEEETKVAILKFAGVIRKASNLVIPKKIEDFDYKLHNVVGSHSVGFPIRLEALRSTAKNFAKYEPETFPGLVFRMNNPKVVLLIFNTGKLVITGAKSRQEVYDAYQSILPLLRNHRNVEQKAKQPAYVN